LNNLVKTIGRRTALARSIILTEIFRENIEAGAPSLIITDLRHLLEYHVGRISAADKPIFERFQFCLFCREDDCSQWLETLQGDREYIKIEGYGVLVAVSEEEYRTEKRIGLAIANKRLRDSGFFGLVKRVIAEENNF